MYLGTLVYELSDTVIEANVGVESVAMLLVVLAVAGTVLDAELQSNPTRCIPISQSL